MAKNIGVTSPGVSAQKKKEIEINESDGFATSTEHVLDEHIEGYKKLGNSAGGSEISGTVIKEVQITREDDNPTGIQHSNIGPSKATDEYGPFMGDGQT